MYQVRDSKRGEISDGVLISVTDSTEVNLDKEAKGTDALRGISIPRISKSPVLFRVLRRWYWNSALRALLTELNNLPTRM